MPKASSDSLYKLVHSLSGSESRYLKLSAKNGHEDSLLIKLLTEIQQQEVFDDELLYKKLKTSFSTRGNFIVKKNHLYTWILKIMRQYNSCDANADSQVRSHCQDIRFLLEKQLFKQAVKVLNRAKALAYKNELYRHLVDLIGLESDLISRDESYTRRAENRRKLNKESRIVFEYARHLIKIDALIQDTKDILDDNLPTGGPLGKIHQLNELRKSKSFTETVTSKLTIAYVAGFYIEQQIEKLQQERVGQVDNLTFFNRYKHFLRTLAEKGKLPFFECHEEFYIEFITHYLRHATLSGENTQKNINEALAFYEPLKAINRNASAQQIGAGYLFALRTAYMQVNKSKFYKSIDRFHKHFEQTLSKLSQNGVFLVYYWLGVNYFLHGDLNTSKYYLKEILRIFDHSTAEPSKKVENAYLVLILLYAEQNDIAALQKHLTRKKYYFKDFQYPDNSDVLRTQIIYFGLHYRDEDVAVLENKVLNEFVVQDRNGSGFYDKYRFEFDYLLWFEAKVTNKSFEKLIKERYQKIP